MFTKYGTLALLLSACIFVGFSGKSNAFTSKQIMDSCKSESLQDFCDGFFLGVTDAHVSSMFLVRAINEDPVCAEWKNYSAGMLRSAFEAEYNAQYKAFQPGEDPSFWMINQVMQNAGCIRVEQAEEVKKDIKI